jgi:hypothetical protein
MSLPGIFIEPIDPPYCLIKLLSAFCICLADWRFALGLLRQAQRLHGIGIVPVLGNDLILCAEHGVVEVPLGGDSDITRRSQRISGIDFRLLIDFLALDSGLSPRELELKEEWKRRVR